MIRPPSTNGSGGFRTAGSPALRPSSTTACSPTGDLDRQSAEDVLALLQALNRDHGKTIVMVTHDPKAAERARQTLHLDKGTLVGQTVSAAA